MSPEKLSGAGKASAAKKAPAAKKASAVRKAPAAKKASAVRKAPAAKKASAVRKAPAAKKASAAKKAPAANKASAARKALFPAVNNTVKIIPAMGAAPAAATAPPAATNVGGNSLTPATDITGAKVQQMLRKDRGVVDSFSGKVDTCHVYEKGNDVYQCTLNQTHFSANNNKYFIIQLLEDDAESIYHVFTRWGRVGYGGQNKTVTFSSLGQALYLFEKTFRQKTANHWGSRARFNAVKGRYELMDIDYGAAEDEAEKSGESSAAQGLAKNPVISELPGEVQGLMKLIGCKETMKRLMAEYAINTEKLPLGKISQAQITRAYSLLKSLEAEIKKANPRLEELSDQFYTLIPHAFGRSRPPLISSESMLRQKMEMLEALGKLEVAVSILNAEAPEEIHPLDKLYRRLNCEITPLSRDEPDFRRIVEYANNTQGPTHRFQVEVKQVFTVRRQDEDDPYESFKRLGNRQMLWHGSRITNFIGILSQGLRIAPPEAPCTGYMFGKGIYLADVCTKSANYCYPSGDTKTGLMLLCEAALGKQMELTDSKYMENPMPGTNATKGVGSYFPDPAGAEVVDGVLWPKGRVRKSRISSSLLYPEHIIYNVGQCRMRWLVHVGFKYH
ncbi:putative poly(ADP-ribose) polymerase [Trypanosoma cruzi]|nr:putative poly(ADP-ribose) polymerase [Trypanosoma cruzi]